MNFKSFLFPVFVAMTCAAPAQVSPQVAAALQNEIINLQASSQVQGISAAAYIPGMGTWKGVVGDSYAGMPIDTNMLFSIGSITKTFLATEIFKLIEAGQLSLDDSLVNLLPPHNNIDPNITVRQLLGHKSGIGDFTNSTWSAAMNNDLNAMWYMPAVVDSFCGAPIFAPGTGWSYCNANYELLGMIIEAKTGDSLHHVLRNNFLQPNNLNETFMEVFEPYSQTIPHNWSSSNFNPPTAIDQSATPHTALWSSAEAAGGYFSSAADLTHWGYNLYSGNIISQASLNDMLTFTNVNSSYYNGYGLGAMRFPGNSHIYWGHAGNYFGYSACMLYYPQDSLSVAVLINTDWIAANIAKPLMNTLINTLATSIHEAISDPSITIAQDMSTQQIFVRSEDATEKTLIKIYDSAGRIVREETGSGAETVLSSAGLSKGLYIVYVSAGDKNRRQKILIP